tara:strand:+ start:59 stop:895 length:837 start_codon:yes stop_codon:yes gene_type:complete
MSEVVNSCKKYGLICGSGIEPMKIARILSEKGGSIFIVKILGEADDDYSVFDQIEVKIGQIEKISKYFSEAGCTDILLLGKIRNQSFSKIDPDFSALQILSQGGKLGDNFLLTAVSKFFERKGFNVIPQDQVILREFLPTGYIFGKKPHGRIAEDIRIGISYLKKSSEFDIGQSLIIQSGRFIALEASEGTDAMIKRAVGMVNPDNSPAIFIKMAKLNQSLELDLPVFGLETIKHLLVSNIKIVCLHAEYCKLSTSLKEIELVMSRAGIALYAVDYET